MLVELVEGFVTKSSVIRVMFYAKIFLGDLRKLTTEHVTFIIKNISEEIRLFSSI